mgnify:CR=1 FL=1
MTFEEFENWSLLIGITGPEQLTERAVVPAACGGELTLRVEHTGGNHGQYQVALTTALAAQQTDQVQAHHRRADGLHRAVGARADDLKQLLGRRQRLALEHGTNRLGLRQRQLREIGDGLLDDPLALADRLAQQNRRR